MSYREYLPHPALRNYIDAYWTVNLDHQAVPGTTRILPDCCTDLIFNRGNTIYNGNQHAEMVPEKSYLVGTMTTYKDTLINPGTATLGIRFRPGGIGAFYKLNQYELTDLAVPYQDKQLAELVWAGTDVIQNINRYFLQKLPVKPGVLSFLINDMYQVKGQLRIPELTGKYHMSERKLERLFRTEVGVTVKGLAKLIRFTHTLAEIRDPARQHSLTQIAYQAGYYDQAHLCNDVKAYTGLTAAQL